MTQKTKKHLRIFASCTLTLILPAFCFADSKTPEQSKSAIHATKKLNSPEVPIFLPRIKAPRIQPSRSELNGWEFLFQKLAEHGVNPQYAARILGDARMPKLTPVPFALEPKEPKNLYRNHDTVANRRRALACFEKHADSFRSATQSFPVPESVILAILQVETSCGSFVGTNQVFYRLARLVSTGDPENLMFNYRDSRRKNPTATPEQYANRAQVLENIFLPHTAATLVLARDKGVHPLDLKGSGAGALGLPQFLPGNYLQFGVDGNNDGKVDLFTHPDAIHSVANFLMNEGWNQKQLTDAEQRKVIWQYNPSEHYVQTVLAMARKLEAELPRRPTPANGNRSRR